MMKKITAVFGVLLFASLATYAQPPTATGPSAPPSNPTALETLIESEQERAPAAAAPGTTAPAITTPAGAADTGSPTAGTLKIVDWNVWMGTDGKGYVKMGDLEDVPTRELRYQLQLDEFKKLDADIIFLQELSPVFKRADHLATELGRQVIAQGDNCGIRIGNTGVPTNLQMGVAILAKPSLKLRRLQFEKEKGRLNPGQLPGFQWGFCHRWGSFQLTERRVYVAGSIEWQGQQIWVMNTHYTSGLGACTPGNNQHCKLLDQWMTTGSLNLDQRVQIEKQLQQADEKRTQASEYLMSLVPEHQPVILGGDFNANPNDKAIQHILQAKFKDTTQTIPPTWSPSQNPSIQEQLIRRKEVLGSRLTPLEQLGLETDRTDNKIDYIFTRDLPGTVHVSSSRAVFNQPIQEHWLSDHFGVEVVLQKQ